MMGSSEVRLSGMRLCWSQGLRVRGKFLPEKELDFYRCGV